jgi:hypothetical protein
MALRVFDAVDCLMLVGEARKEVERALAKYVGRGATVILEPRARGPQWTAACTPAPQSDFDVTDRLQAPELDEPACHTRTPSTTLNDGCRVTAVGAMRIVSGPGSRQVSGRLHSLAIMGYRLVGEIVQYGAKWIAIVEAQAADRARQAFRW